MNCKFCGKEIWLAGLFKDRDFCVPSHRKKFHERLRNVMVQSEASEIQALRLADSRFLASPADGLSVAALSAHFESLTVPQPTSVEWLSTAAMQVAAPAWETEVTFEATPSMPEAEPVTAMAVDTAPESVEAALATPPDMPYDERLQRVENLISSMRATIGQRKSRGLHTAA